jgi:hypothetical protein
MHSAVSDAGEGGAVHGVRGPGGRGVDWRSVVGVGRTGDATGLCALTLPFIHLATAYGEGKTECGIEYKYRMHDMDAGQVGSMTALSRTRRRTRIQLSAKSAEPSCRHLMAFLSHLGRVSLKMLCELGTDTITKTRTRTKESMRILTLTLAARRRQDLGLWDSGTGCLLRTVLHGLYPPHLAKRHWTPCYRACSPQPPTWPCGRC